MNSAPVRMDEEEGDREEETGNGTRKREEWWRSL